MGGCVGSRGWGGAPVYDLHLCYTNTIYTYLSEGIAIYTYVAIFFKESGNLNRISLITYIATVVVSFSIYAMIEMN